MCHRGEFRHHLRHSRCFTGKVIFIDYNQGKSLCPKLGITVTRRFGQATERNRFKRLCRESFRLHQHLLPRGTILHLRPTGASKGAQFEAFCQDLVSFVTYVRAKRSANSF